MSYDTAVESQSVPSRGGAISMEQHRRGRLLKQQLQLVARKTPDGKERKEIAVIPETLSFEKGFFLFIRAVQLLTQNNEGMVLVGLAGPSGAGKTVFSAKVLNFMPGITVISMDNYNVASRVIDGNFDDPRITDYELLLSNLQGLREGRTVQVPIYDFKCSTRVGFREVKVPKSRIVIIEGIYALSERLRPLLDLRVSITGGVHFDLVKRVLRDIDRSGQAPEEIIHQISETVYPMYKAFIEPDLQTAHIRIVNKFNPFSGFQDATYILKAPESDPAEAEARIRSVLSAEAVAGSESEETYDIYLLPPGEDKETCQSYLRMRNRDGRYSLMFEECVTDGPFVITPRITFEVSVRLLGGLMALGYEMAHILRRESRVFRDKQQHIVVKVDRLEQIKKTFMQVQGKDRKRVRDIAGQLGMEGRYSPRLYIEEIQLHNLTEEVQALSAESVLKERFRVADHLLPSGSPMGAPLSSSLTPPLVSSSWTLGHKFDQSNWSKDQQGGRINASPDRLEASPSNAATSANDTPSRRHKREGDRERAGAGGRHADSTGEGGSSRRGGGGNGSGSGSRSRNMGHVGVGEEEGLEGGGSGEAGRVTSLVQSQERISEQLTLVTDRLDELLSRLDLVSAGSAGSGSGNGGVAGNGGSSNIQLSPATSALTSQLVSGGNGMLGGRNGSRGELAGPIDIGSGNGGERRNGGGGGGGGGGGSGGKGGSGGGGRLTPVSAAAAGGGVMGLVNGAAVGVSGNSQCYDVNAVNGVGSGAEGRGSAAPGSAAAALVVEVKEIASNQRRLASELDSLGRLLRDSLDSDGSSSARFRSSHPHLSHYSLSSSSASGWSLSRAATGIALPAIAACAVGVGVAVLVGVRRSVLGDVLRGSNPAALRGSNPAALRGSNPAVLRGSNPAVLRGSNPAVLRGSNPAVLRGSNPAVLRGSNPARLGAQGRTERQQIKPAVLPGWANATDAIPAIPPPLSRPLCPPPYYFLVCRGRAVSAEGRVEARQPRSRAVGAEGRAEKRLPRCAANLAALPGWVNADPCDPPSSHSPSLPLLSSSSSGAEAALLVLRDALRKSYPGALPGWVNADPCDNSWTPRIKCNSAGRVIRL
ncbi:unnamed protein product [Closterium sp. NIES-65]|nr:unnamed protein product [Closterium sp. NIES-65]